MPKIEDLERLGSIAFLIGNKKLPKELSKDDYDAFKSVFTNDYMESSTPSEDDDLPSIDEIGDLSSNEEDKTYNDNTNDNEDNSNLPEKSKENSEENLEENDNKISSNLEELNLPDNLETDNEDEKIISNINDLELPNDLNIIEDNKNDSNNESDLQDRDLGSLPILDDLPLPESLPDIEYDANNIVRTDTVDDLGIGDISHLSDLDDDNAIEETLEENDEENDKDDIEEIISDNEDLEEILEDDKEYSDTSEIENETEDYKDIEEIDDSNIDNTDIEDNLIKDDILDESILDEEESKKEELKTEEPQKVEDKIEDDSDTLHLDDLENMLDELDEDEIIEDKIKKEESEEIKEDTKETEKDETEKDTLYLDDLENILDDEEEIHKTEEPQKVEDKIEDNSDTLHLDNLENILDENEEIAEIEKPEKSKETDDLISLDSLDNLDIADDIDKKASEEESKESPVQIMEGGTSLPSPDMADKLGDSRYEHLGEDVDRDKIIDGIKNLSPLTRYHVLDVILNEKLDEDSMKELLSALESGKSNEDITEFINKELGLSIKEYGKKGILDLIPIPNSLKDYAHIIRVAAVFLVLFVGIVLLSYQFIYKPVKAREYFKRGLADIENGAYNDAEKNFAEGDRLKPKQIKWFNRYGKAYIEREMFQNALTKIEGALNIKPRDFDSRILFGYYYRTKGEKQLSEDDYIKGEELYNDMISYVSKKNQLKTVYDELGILMISRARNLSQPAYYDNAYNNYIQMINLFGDNVVARKRAMLIRIYQNNYSQVKALQQHIDNLKRGYIDDDVYPKLARYLLNNDDFYSSRTLLEKILKKYPTNIEAIVGYADYEARLKHYERARDILINTALPLYENNPYLRGKEFVYNMLGQIYYNLGEYGSSINNFNAALAINQTYPDANFNLANLYFYQDKDYEKAREHYQLAYDNLPPALRGDQLLYNLSWIYYLNNEFDRAFEGFNALFQKNPSNSVVSYALGNSLLHLDKANLANGFYRNALNQILARREKLGRLEMRTESDFFLLSYLASLYNNIGVSYAYNSAIGNTIQNEQEAFRNFVLASEYFDQIRTSNIDLERMEKRTVLVENNNVGVSAYNVMVMQSKRALKDSVMIDDYIPKDMYYVR